MSFFEGRIQLCGNVDDGESGRILQERKEQVASAIDADRLDAILSINEVAICVELIDIALLCDQKKVLSHMHPETLRALSRVGDMIAADETSSDQKYVFKRHMELVHEHIVLEGVANLAMHFALVFPKNEAPPLELCFKDCVAKNGRLLWELKSR